MFYHNLHLFPSNEKLLKTKHYYTVYSSKVSTQKNITSKKKYFSSTSVSLMLIDETHFRSFFLSGNAFVLFLLFSISLPSLLLPLLHLIHLFGSSYFILFVFCRSFHKFYIFYFITDIYYLHTINDKTAIIKKANKAVVIRRNVGQAWVFI